MQAVKNGKVPTLTIAWLVTVARNKLVDHWRRLAREERNLTAVAGRRHMDDPIDEHFERMRAHEVLAELGAHHRAALTLRYLDGLSVPEVADQLGRTVHATEALLVRRATRFALSTPKKRTRREGVAMTTDPFDALREPVAPLAPRPEFAAQLRRRIVAELGPDQEDTAMPTTRDP